MNLKKIMTMIVLAICLPSVSYGESHMNFEVTNANDSGPGSLREAVNNFNNSLASHDRISFKIPESGPFTIKLLTDIIVNKSPGVINGYSQRGAQPGNELISIVGEGQLKTAPGEDVTIIGIKRIRQPKSLREQSIAAVAQKVDSGVISLEQAKKILPPDLHGELRLKMLNISLRRIGSRPDATEIESKTKRYQSWYKGNPK